MRILLCASPAKVLIVVRLLTTTLSDVEWVGGAVPVSRGFPLETCGNDGLGEKFTAACRELDPEMKRVTREVP
jgi:hypothetical protein